MLLAALLNLILTPLFVVGAPIIIRVTMESSHTLYGIGMGLIDFATIIGALSIGFCEKLQMQTLYYWMILIALLVIPMALSVTPVILNLGYYPPFILFYTFFYFNCNDYDSCIHLCDYCSPKENTK